MKTPTIKEPFHVKLAIQFVLHLKYNVKKHFKDNFYDMSVVKNKKSGTIWISAINYTGWDLNFSGKYFSGEYSNCILNPNKAFKKLYNRSLYFISGSYPIYTTDEFLQEDLERAKNTNLLKEFNIYKITQKGEVVLQETIKKPY